MDDITTSGSLQFEFKAIEAATSNFHNIISLVMVDLVKFTRYSICSTYYLCYIVCTKQIPVVKSRRSYELTGNVSKCNTSCSEEAD